MDRNGIPPCVGTIYSDKSIREAGDVYLPVNADGEKLLPDSSKTSLDRGDGAAW